MQTHHNAPLLREAINYDKYKGVMARDLFDAFLDMDPTKDKKYTAWIILWFMKGFDVVETVKKVKLPDSEKYPMSYGFLMGIHNPWPTTNEAERISRFMKEDHYKVTEDLEAYDKLKRKKALSSERDYNIMNVFGFDTLADMVAEKAQVLDGLADSEMKPEDYEKWYEDGDWLVVVPKTVAAAQKYGANTRWCTAARNLKDNMFDYYNDSGELIIFIDKKGGRKWQVHLESKQWMDEMDREIDKAAFVTEIPMVVRRVVFERTQDIRFAEDQESVIRGLLGDGSSASSLGVKKWLDRHLSKGTVVDMMESGDDPCISDQLWQFAVADYSSDKGVTYEDAYSYGYDNPENFLDEDPSDEGEWSDDQRTEAGIKAEGEAERDDIAEFLGKITSNFRDAERSYGNSQCAEVVEYALTMLIKEGTPEEIARATVAIMNSAYNDDDEELVDCVNNLILAKAMDTGPYAADASEQKDLVAISETRKVQGYMVRAKGLHEAGYSVGEILDELGYGIVNESILEDELRD